MVVMLVFIKKVEGEEHGGSPVGQAWKGHTSSLPTSFCLEVSHMASFEKCSLAVYPRKRGNWFGAQLFTEAKEFSISEVNDTHLNKSLRYKLFVFKRQHVFMCINQN